MRSLLFVSFIFLLEFICHSDGSGAMYDPVSRAVMWKYGFPTNKNYNFMQLNCGGQKGLENCGVCGDPLEGPRDHEAGGLYGSRAITRYYEAGTTEINVRIELYVDEKGYFEFYICPVNNGTVTQACLKKYHLPIKEGYMKRTPMKFPPGRAGDFNLTIALPPGLRCDRCVLQWRYHTGNSWGRDSKTGVEGMGRGRQEEFLNCADIRIGGERPPGIVLNKDLPPPSIVGTIKAKKKQKIRRLGLQKKLRRNGKKTQTTQRKITKATSSISSVVMDSSKLPEAYDSTAKHGTTIVKGGTKFLSHKTAKDTTRTTMLDSGAIVNSLGFGEAGANIFDSGANMLDSGRTENFLDKVMKKKHKKGSKIVSLLSSSHSSVGFDGSSVGTSMKHVGSLPADVVHGTGTVKSQSGIDKVKILGSSTDSAEVKPGPFVGTLDTSSSFSTTVDVGSTSGSLSESPLVGGSSQIRTETEAMTSGKLTHKKQYGAVHKPKKQLNSGVLTGSAAMDASQGDSQTVKSIMSKPHGMQDGLVSLLGTQQGSDILAIGTETVQTMHTDKTEPELFQGQTGPSLLDGRGGTSSMESLSRHTQFGVHTGGSLITNAKMESKVSEVGEMGLNTGNSIVETGSTNMGKEKKSGSTITMLGDSGKFDMGPSSVVMDKNSGAGVSFEMSGMVTGSKSIGTEGQFDGMGQTMPYPGKTKTDSHVHGSVTSGVQIGTSNMEAGASSMNVKGISGDILTDGIGTNTATAGLSFETVGASTGSTGVGVEGQSGLIETTFSEAGPSMGTDKPTTGLSLGASIKGIKNVAMETVSGEAMRQLEMGPISTGMDKSNTGLSLGMGSVETGSKSIGNVGQAVGIDTLMGDTTGQLEMGSSNVGGLDKTKVDTKIMGATNAGLNFKTSGMETASTVLDMQGHNVGEAGSRMKLAVGIQMPDGSAAPIVPQTISSETKDTSSLQNSVADKGSGTDLGRRTTNTRAIQVISREQATLMTSSGRSGLQKKVKHGLSHIAPKLSATDSNTLMPSQTDTSLVESVDSGGAQQQENRAFFNAVFSSEPDVLLLNRGPAGEVVKGTETSSNAVLHQTQETAVAHSTKGAEHGGSAGIETVLLEGVAPNTIVEPTSESTSSGAVQNNVVSSGQVTTETKSQGVSAAAGSNVRTDFFGSVVGLGTSEGADTVNTVDASVGGTSDPNMVMQAQNRAIIGSQGQHDQPSEISSLNGLRIGPPTPKIMMQFPPAKSMPLPGVEHAVTTIPVSNTGVLSENVYVPGSGTLSVEPMQGKGDQTASDSQNVQASSQTSGATEQTQQDAAIQRELESFTVGQRGSTRTIDMTRVGTRIGPVQFAGSGLSRRGLGMSSSRMDRRDRRRFLGMRGGLVGPDIEGRFRGFIGRDIDGRMEVGPPFPRPPPGFVGMDPRMRIPFIDPRTGLAMDLRSRTRRRRMRIFPSGMAAGIRTGPPAGDLPPDTRIEDFRSMGMVRGGSRGRFREFTLGRGVGGARFMTRGGDLVPFDFEAGDTMYIRRRGAGALSVDGSRSEAAAAAAGEGGVAGGGATGDVTEVVAEPPASPTGRGLVKGGVDSTGGALGSMSDGGVTSETSVIAGSSAAEGGFTGEGVAPTEGVVTGEGAVTGGEGGVSAGIGGVAVDLRGVTSERDSADFLRAARRADGTRLGIRRGGFRMGPPEMFGRDGLVRVGPALRFGRPLRRLVPGPDAGRIVIGGPPVPRPIRRLVPRPFRYSDVRGPVPRGAPFPFPGFDPGTGRFVRVPIIGTRPPLPGRPFPVPYSPVVPIGL